MHVDEQGDVSSGLKRRPRRRGGRWIAIAAVIAIATGWLVLEDGQSSASVTILPPTHAVTAMPGPILDRVIPPSWGWLWQLRRALFGAPVTVDVAHTMFEFNGDGEARFVAAIKGRPALTSSNGVTAWVISRQEAAELGKLRANTNMGSIRTGKVSMGPGIVATISSTVAPAVAGGNVLPGTSATYAVRPRPSGVELRATFVSWRVIPKIDTDSAELGEVSESITNVHVAVASYVPEGKALYLTSAGRVSGQSPSTGILIVPIIK